MRDVQPDLRSEGSIPVVKRRSYLGASMGGLVILAATGMAYLLYASENIDWSVVGEYLFDDRIVYGVGVTIRLAVVAMVIGLVVGTLIGVARLSKSPIVRTAAVGYVTILRSVPILVQLIFWGNLGLFVERVSLGVPGTGIEFFGQDTNSLLSPFVAASIGLGLHEAAYVAEFVRGGILAVDHGQVEAATALGMRPSRIMRRIVLPQAIPMVVPALGNQFTILIKATSLVSVISGGDLLTQTNNISATNYRIIEMLLVASLWYLVLVGVSSMLQAMLERYIGKARRR